VELPESYFKSVNLSSHPDLPIILTDHVIRGRKVREIDFSSDPSSLKAGSFRALDFFGDGSFFLLDAPGHAVGHLSALARTTTNPDTFIFMGGDLCHHGGEIRPSAHLPIPDEVKCLSLNSRPHVCLDGALLRKLNFKRGRKPDEPFYDPVLTVDLTRNIQTIKEAQEADAQDNVLFVFAHDMWISDIVDFFPKSANDWKSKGWREDVMWRFLADLSPAAV
jgi:hypothetical protein